MHLIIKIIKYRIVLFVFFQILLFLLGFVRFFKYNKWNFWNVLVRNLKKNAFFFKRADCVAWNGSRNKNINALLTMHESDRRVGRYITITWGAIRLKQRMLSWQSSFDIRSKWQLHGSVSVFLRFCFHRSVVDWSKDSILLISVYLLRFLLSLQWNVYSGKVVPRFAVFRRVYVRDRFSDSTYQGPLNRVRNFFGLFFFTP